jgi:hypothetical protein
MCSFIRTNRSHSEVRRRKSCTILKALKTYVESGKCGLQHHIICFNGNPLIYFKSNIFVNTFPKDLRGIFKYDFNIEEIRNPWCVTCIPTHARRSGCIVIRGSLTTDCLYTWPSQPGLQNLAITTWPSQLAFRSWPSLPPIYMYLAIATWLSDGPSLHQIYTPGHHNLAIILPTVNARPSLQPGILPPSFNTLSISWTGLDVPALYSWSLSSSDSSLLISIFHFSCSAIPRPLPRPYWHAFPGFLPG